ncbi:MAG: hypothetical protein IKI97_09625 [Clostridia bacterium]|nr:hypothetical protein [Clostridia bacterium]
MMTVRELAEKLSLKSINVDDDTREISGAYTGDLLSWVMGRAKQDNLWITIMSNINVIAVASLCDLSMVILSENSTLDDDALEKAKIQGINIYSSELASYELCCKVGTLI